MQVLQYANSRGLAWGVFIADVEQAKAAGNVIITCEELMETDKLRESPDQNQIPFFCVDAVVSIPFGAYPTACFRYYDYDPVYLNDYRMAAQVETSYRAYLEEYVLGIRNQANCWHMSVKSGLKK